MRSESAYKAASASSVALMTFVLSLGLLVHQCTKDSEMNIALIVVSAIAAASSAILHLIFIALFAQRMGWSPLKTTALALFTLPIGSAIGLILYEWQTKVDSAPEKNAA